MKRTFTKIISAFLVVVLAATFALPAFAASKYNFDRDGAYATIVTGSDFQKKDALAYTRYYKILSKMKEDGLETPAAILAGGDYSKFLPDSPAPGLNIIKEYTKEIYPDMKDEDIVLIQGNHDIMSSGFTKTGWYDMGSFLLYAINEDNFPWRQGLRPDAKLVIKNLAKDVKKKLNETIEKGDTRPVIILTHVPLHCTDRTNGLDNKYSSILFDVLNEAGKKLDIVFLFGHNHSDNYDDYIGGSVNFLAPGDTIRIPDSSSLVKNNYNEETLNFTYTNCGYTGYANTSSSDTSTRALTLGAIRLKANSIIFVKYTEDGMFNRKSITRINQDDAMSETDGVRVTNIRIWDFIKRILSMMPFLTKIFHALSK